MNLPARMAWRYLFARKSTNAINIITFIATFGVAIGAAALLIVLSVFNGFEDTFLGMFNNLNPDVRITAVRGKTFELTDELLAGLKNTDGVLVVSETLEETAAFEYNGRQSFGPLKGVDSEYPGLNGIDTMLAEGKYDLDHPSTVAQGAIVGDNLALELLIDPLNKFSSLSIYVPRPRARGVTTFGSGRLPVQVREVMPTGMVRSQQAFQNQTVLVNLSLVREILGVGERVITALEIKLSPGFDTEETYAELAAIAGPELAVKNRFEQENSILKLMQVEKWVCFAISCLMMILISFNLVGALWMIVLEKKHDIAILRSLGMVGGKIGSIFLRVGLLICGFGLLSGFGIAILLYFLQKNYVLISLPGIMAEAYPMSLRPTDFIIVTLTVLTIGLLASLLPARRAAIVTPVTGEE